LSRCHGAVVTVSHGTINQSINQSINQPARH
jgi:hypothetical protein